MRAAALTEAGTLATGELPDAQVAPGEVRVAVRFCGSDLHWHRHFPAATVMGHEVTGANVEVGPKVDEWCIGRRVCVLPAQHCGECAQCKAGLPNICSARPFGIAGPRYKGRSADHVVALSSMIIAIPDTLDHRVAALAEPLTVALHAIAVADIEPSVAVMVIGAGAISLSIILALRAKGFREIVAVESNEARRSWVCRTGFTAVSPDDATAGIDKAPFAIFECAGYPKAIADAIGHIAPGGRIIVMSNPAEAVPVPQNDLMLKEAQIRSSMFYLRSEFEEAIRMPYSGLVDIADVPVVAVPLEDAGDAFADLLTPETSKMKVLLQP